MFAGCAASSANGSAGYHNKLYSALSIGASRAARVTSRICDQWLSVDETAVAGEIFGRHELQVVELSVFLPAREQLVVRAIFDDSSVNDHHDPVCATHGGQPMRNHQRRAIRHQVFERFLH